MSYELLTTLVKHGVTEGHPKNGYWEDLSDIGLRVRYRDGSENVFLGVLCYPGEWTTDAVERFCREAQAVVYVPNPQE